MAINNRPNSYRVKTSWHALRADLSEDGLYLIVEADEKTYQTGKIDWTMWDRLVTFIEWRRMELGATAKAH